jgi:twitching motility protein PilT
MNPDLLWFVRLGVEQGMFTRAEAVQVRTRLGGRATMLDFAQAMVDGDVVTDVEALEKLATVAASKARAGGPPQDPFVAADDLVEDLVPMPPKREEAGPAPMFAFETIGTLDDKALGEALKGLLGSSIRFGASDLHLSTGRRPFVRKDRAITFISEHSLTSTEALRLNTVLLTPQQSKVFKEKHDLDYALALGESERYRVNLMLHKDGSAASYRIVPKETKTMQELGFAAHLDTLKKLLS